MYSSGSSSTPTQSPPPSPRALPKQRHRHRQSPSPSRSFMTTPAAPRRPPPFSLLRYLQRKRYQYEVTFSLYMLTPTEKFIFNSLLFLALSLLLIAASLYLPEHLLKIWKRAWFYYSGLAPSPDVISGPLSLCIPSSSSTSLPSSARAICSASSTGVEAVVAAGKKVAAAGAGVGGRAGSNTSSVAAASTGKIGTASRARTIGAAVSDGLAALWPVSGAVARGAPQEAL